MKLGKRLLVDAKVAFNSLFRGMKAADDVMLKQVHGGGETEIVQNQTGGGVMADISQGKITNEVKETIDANYRILKESKKYKSNVKFTEENGYEGGVVKKTLEDFLKHPPVLVHDGEKLKVIQDNEKTSKGNSFNLEDVLNSNEYDYDTLLKIIREGYQSRFNIEKFIKRIVVKSIEGSERNMVDLYLSSYPNGYNVVEGLLVNQLKAVMEKNETNVDFLRFDGIAFVTHNAWNSDDFSRYMFDDIKFKGIEKFDGNFVLRFDCEVVEDGYDVTEKYKTESLTKKYEKKERRIDSPDIFAVTKRVESDEKNNSENEITNLGNVTF